MVGWLSFPKGVRKIDVWATKSNVEVTLYNVGVLNDIRDPEDRPSLLVVCRRFFPTPDDQLSKSWNSKGKRIDCELPTYAIPPKKLAATARKLDDLVDAHFHRLLTELTYSQDDIITTTFAEATRHAGTVSIQENLPSGNVTDRSSARCFKGPSISPS